MSNKAKHTPGPWNATELDGPARGHRISIHNVDTGDYVAQVNYPADPTAAANAALIAAAPELLAALRLFDTDKEDFLDLLAVHAEDVAAGRMDKDEARQKAREARQANLQAAIAKAEGRA